MEPLTLRDEIAYKMRETRRHAAVCRVAGWAQAFAALKGRLWALREVGRLVAK
jgi:hypothetical protein